MLARAMCQYVAAALFACASCLWLSTYQIRADSLCVGGSGCFASIQAAVSAASVGDTITVAAGLYAEHISITKPITLIGSGAAVTVVDGSDTDTVFVVSTGSGTTVALIGLTIQHGRAENQGGGVANRGVGTLMLNDDVIRNNVASAPHGGAANAGGVFSAGTLIVNRSVISGNTATNTAGGVFVYGTATISDSSISGNTAEAYCGGIYNDGTMNLTAVTVDGNTPGGIYNQNYSTLTVTSSTISSNTGGDGIENIAGSVTLLNSTVGRNAGRGIANGPNDIGQPGIVTIKNSTITENNGGVASPPFPPSTSAIALTSSVVMGNTANGGLDLSGRITSYGNNLFSQPYSTPNHDIIAADAHLTPLQNNGGPTLTFAPLPGSPAIDVIPQSGGCGVGISVDQRGIPRPQGSACDIGAVEFSVVFSTLDPAVGPTAGGSIVTLGGDNFGASTSVMFGSSPATVLTVTKTQIMVRAPAHGAGAVSVVVNTSGQIRTMDAAFTFVQVNPLPGMRPSAPTDPSAPGVLPPPRPALPPVGSPSPLPHPR